MAYRRAAPRVEPATSLRIASGRLRYISPIHPEEQDFAEYSSSNAGLHTSPKRMRGHSLYPSFALGLVPLLPGSGINGKVAQAAMLMAEKAKILRRLQ